MADCYCTVARVIIMNTPPAPQCLPLPVSVDPSLVVHGQRKEEEAAPAAEPFKLKQFKNVKSRFASATALQVWKKTQKQKTDVRRKTVVAFALPCRPFFFFFLSLVPPGV